MDKREECARAHQNYLADVFAGQKQWDDLSLPEQAARLRAFDEMLAVLREPVARYREETQLPERR